MAVDKAMEAHLNSSNSTGRKVVVSLLPFTRSTWIASLSKYNSPLPSRHDLLQVRCHSAKTNGYALYSQGSLHC